MNLLNINPADISLFDDGIKQLRKLLDTIEISGNGALEDIVSSYDDLKELSAKLFKIQNGSFSNQLNQAEKLLISKAGTISIEFEKLAKNFLSRWVKRQKLKILPNSDDRIRLEASKKILNLIDIIDKFQNSLEKNEQNIDVLKDNFLAIGVNLGELSDDLFYLAKTHNDEYEQNRLNGKRDTNLIKLNVMSRLHKLKEEMSVLSHELNPSLKEFDTNKQLIDKEIEKIKQKNIIDDLREDNKRKRDEEKKQHKNISKTIEEDNLPQNE